MMARLEVVCKFCSIAMLEDNAYLTIEGDPVCDRCMEQGREVAEAQAEARDEDLV